MAIAIKPFAGVRLYPGVHEHIAGAAIKTDDAGFGARRGQVGQVGHAANVGDDAATFLTRRIEDAGMKNRHERCALAAGGDIALTEIANDGNTCGLYQRMRGIELQGITATRLVADGLAVRANGGNLRWVDAGFLQQAGNGSGVHLDQRLAGNLAAMQFVVLWALQGQKLLAQSVGHGDEVMSYNAHTGRVVIGLAHQYGIDTIQTGAGHEANEVAGAAVRRLLCRRIQAGSLICWVKCALINYNCSLTKLLPRRLARRSVFGVAFWNNILRTRWH